MPTKQLPKPTAKPPQAPARGRRAKIWLALVLSTFCTIVAMNKGFRIKIGGMPAVPGWIVGTLVIWLLITAGVGGTGWLLRRSHRPVRAMARRQSARAVRSGAGRTAQWADTRSPWLARWLRERLQIPVPAPAGAGAGPQPQSAPASVAAPAGAASQPAATRAGGGAALTPRTGGTAMNGPRRTAGPGNGPARQQHWSVLHSSGMVPAGWGVVAARAQDFQAQTDEELLGFLAGEFMGMLRYAESLVATHEAHLSGTRLHPDSIEAVHQVSDAVTLAAGIMDKAGAKFAEHYELPRAYAANGGVLPKDGDFLTGNG